MTSYDIASHHIPSYYITPHHIISHGIFDTTQNQKKQLLASQESAMDEKTKTFERKLDEMRRARVRQENRRDVTNRQASDIILSLSYDSSLL